MHCPVARCRNRRGTIGPEQERTLAPPRGPIGRDVFCWLGHRRVARHWSVPPLRGELGDTCRIRLSDDAVEDYVQRYPCMAAGRQREFTRLGAEYATRRPVTLPIDGSPPGKGHDTLYVVREPGRQRVWFARPPRSSAAEEIRPLIEQAKDRAERLGGRVRVWIPDKPEAFATTIASACPGVPRRYCGHHSLRDVAKPMPQLDSHAKVRMRRGTRGLRAIERQVLTERKVSPPGPNRDPAPPAGRDVVLDHCAAVRGILNDGQGGPPRPPGLRMSAALGDVRRSLRRNLRLKKGRDESRLERLPGGTDRGRDLVPRRRDGCGDTSRGFGR